MHIALWLAALFVGQLTVCSANKKDYLSVVTLMSPTGAIETVSSAATTTPAASQSQTRAVVRSSKPSTNGAHGVVDSTVLPAVGKKSVSVPTVSSFSSTTINSDAIVAFPSSTIHATKIEPSDVAPIEEVTEILSDIFSSKMDVHTETTSAATRNMSSRPSETISFTTSAAVSTNTTIDNIAKILSSSAMPLFASSPIAAEHIESTSSSLPLSPVMTMKTMHTITPTDIPQPAVLNTGEKDQTPFTPATTIISSLDSRMNENTMDMSARVHSNVVEQKLDTGLHRVKLAEIITDQFDNGLNDHYDESNSLTKQSSMMMAKKYRAPVYNNGKINIADLYPSKLEDFSPIIRESNEKLIKEKNLLTGSDSSGSSRSANIEDSNNFDHNDSVMAARMPDAVAIEDGYQQIIYAQSDEQQSNNNGAFNSVSNNIPTTKIEIELIDEPITKDEVKVIAADVNGDNEADGIIDLTAKLQENDGVISAIEHNFLKTENSDNIIISLLQQTSSMTEVSTLVGPTTTDGRPMEFIERRVKKHDPTSKNRFSNASKSKRIDAANTNIDGDNTGKVEATITTTIKSSNKSTELSGKLQYETSKTNKINSVGGLLASTMAGKVMTTLPTANGNEAKPTVAVVKNPVDTQTILFFNMNGILNQREEERLKKDRQQIIKEKNVLQSNVYGEHEAEATNKAQKPGYPNMHLYVIHGENKVAGKVNQKSTKASVANTESSTAAAISANTTAIKNVMYKSLTSKLTINSSNSEKPYSRPRVLTRLQEKINSLDCDMQKSIPTDANVWRGNETHELNLPTTVSPFLYLFSYHVIHGHNIVVYSENMREPSQYVNVMIHKPVRYSD